MAMFAVHGDGRRAPTLKEAARELRIEVSELDAGYGVQLVDWRNHTYAVRSSAAWSETDERAHADLPIDAFTF